MVGALLMAAIIPLTLVVILPTNSYLLSAAAEKDMESAALSLARWNRLHGLRTALSAVAFVVFSMLLAK